MATMPIDPINFSWLYPVPYITLATVDEWKTNIHERCVENSIELCRLHPRIEQPFIFGHGDNPFEALVRSQHIDGLLRDLIENSIDAETKKNIWPTGTDFSYVQPAIIPNSSSLVLPAFQPTAPYLFECVDNYFLNQINTQRKYYEGRLEALHYEGIAGLNKLVKQRKHNKPEFIAQWGLNMVEEHRRRAQPLMAAPFYHDEFRLSAQLFSYFQNRAPRLWKQYEQGGLFDKMPYQLANFTCHAYYRNIADSAAAKIKERARQEAEAESEAEAKAKAAAEAKARAEANASTEAMVQDAVAKGLAAHVNRVSRTSSSSSDPSPSFSPLIFLVSSPPSTPSPSCGPAPACAVSGNPNNGPSQLN